MTNVEKEMSTLEGILHICENKDGKKKKHIISLTTQISTYLDKASEEGFEYLEESINLPITSIDGVTTNTQLIVELIRDHIEFDVEHKKEQYSIIISLSTKPCNIICRCQGYHNECSLDFSGVTKVYISDKFRPESENEIYNQVSKCIDILKDLEYAPSSTTFFEKRETKEEHLKNIKSWIHEFSDIENIEISFEECVVCYTPTRVKTRCNHSLCLKCTDKLCKYLQDSLFPCPICRAQTRVICDVV